MKRPGFLDDDCAIPDLADPASVRRAIRDRRFTGFTNLVARGYVQGNLVAASASHADAFELYCRSNPQALPILGRSAAGSRWIPELATDLDLARDAGGYMVFHDGDLVETPHDAAPFWRDDLVAFVLGCSFSFEAIMQAQGGAPRSVALHGGIGTLEEFMEAWTLNQLGEIDKPVGLYNVGGFHDPFMAFVDTMIAERFLPAEHRRGIVVEADPEALIDGLAAFEQPVVPKWL